ncbi:MAG: aldo/keto reductase [Bacillota bacterium]|nr:aldo/keto reductase [Bacillota bacterium]MDW7677890.1 aldo/keto reductase [Bacillota bacterium]
MIYRPYGSTGKMVSVIGFGGMRFGKDDDYAAEVVRHANTKGINYFDTAPFYCDDRSEFIFGKAIRKMPGEYYVSTKSLIRKEKTADEVRARIEKSLARMGVNQINFFHMWCIMDLEQYRNIMAPGGPYEGAMKAKSEGLVEHVVFSTHCRGRDIRTIIEDDVFEGVLLGYNVINHPFRQEGVQAALENNLGVVTMNPLGGGLIPRYSDHFSFIREREDESTVQAALRFNAAQPGITVVLSGMGTMEEVDENVGAVDHPLTVTAAKMDEIGSRITEKLDTLCTNCQYCREKKCPSKIKMNYFMEAYNLFLLMGSESETLRQLDWYRKQGDMGDDEAQPGDCIACGICEELCTQKLPIIDRLKEVQDMLDKQI